MRRLFEAYIGESNKDYYLQKFEVFEWQPSGLRPSWNWSAFLATGLWALYRKMYGWFFGWWGLITLSSILGKSISPLLAAPIILISTVGFAIFANSIYYNKCKEKIAIAQLTYKNESSLLGHLTRKGGVHLSVVWVFVFVFITGVITSIVIPKLSKSSNTADASISDLDWLKNQVADLERRCSKNDFMGCDGLGIMYGMGKGVQQDKFKAVELFTKACDGGFAGGCLSLGFKYAVGEGVRQDKRKAVELLIKACDGGESNGCLAVGGSYMYGEGVKKDKAKALQVYGKACDMKNELGCNYYASLKNEGVR
jgi:hypothetical protein